MTPKKRRSSNRKPNKKSVKKVTKKSECRTALSRKIAINMAEMRDRQRFISRAQAIAVAYAQILSKMPHCKKYFSQK